MAKASKSIPKDSVSNVSKIEAYLNKRYHFRHNPILERTEFKTKSQKAYQLLSERDVNSLYRELNNNDLRCSVTSLRSLLNSDFVKEEDPFKNYFNGLPSWKKGDPDYIDKLANTVIAENDEFWRWSFKKWIVNLVACAVSDNVNQQVLVFVGKQGLGKSTWLNALMPKELEGYLFSGIVNPSNKDTLVNLAENLIINLDELENLNKTELGSLKSLITQSAIRLRRAYGIYNENFVRRASFVGSVNEVEFLTDTTGNRRYLVIEATDIKYNHGLNLDLVYSQAFSLFNNKFKYYFDKEDIHRIDENNLKFVRLSTEEELLLKHFRVPQKDDKNIVLLTTTEIVNLLQEETKLKLGDPSSVKRLGGALHKHGFPRTSKTSSKPYQLVKIDKSQMNHVPSDPVPEDYKYILDGKTTNYFVTASKKQVPFRALYNGKAYEIGIDPDNESVKSIINKVIGNQKFMEDLANILEEGTPEEMIMDWIRSKIVEDITQNK